MCVTHYEFNEMNSLEAKPLLTFVIPTLETNVMYHSLIKI